jgi:hypothetical protein
LKLAAIIPARLACNFFNGQARGLLACSHRLRFVRCKVP